MLLAWQVSLRTNTHKAAEIMRPLTLFIVGACHLFLHGWSTKSNAALYFLMFWSFKQALFNALTFQGTEKVAFYYQEFMGDSKVDKHSICLFYLVQGLYVWVLALPFYFIAKQAGYSWVDMILYTALFSALLIETIAEINAYFFEKENEKTINKQGLWAHCRHPDYFAHWLVFVCFSLLGLYNILSLLSLFSCFFLYSIIRVYLIPISEKYSLLKHPQAYLEYQQKIPAFFPSWDA